MGAQVAQFANSTICRTKLATHWPLALQVSPPGHMPQPLGLGGEHWSGPQIFPLQPVPGVQAHEPETQDRLPGQAPHPLGLPQASGPQTFEPHPDPVVQQALLTHDCPGGQLPAPHWPPQPSDAPQTAPVH